VSPSDTDAYVFEAELVDYPGVARTVAVRGDQALEDLHEVLRQAFEWFDDHLYSFWLSGEFWGDAESEFTAPGGGGARRAETADVELDRLGLEAGQKIAYLFDYGDQWHVELRLADIRPAGAERYPLVLASRGEAPPQYEPIDDEELGAGD
jgi:hypothetical protein